MRILRLRCRGEINVNQFSLVQNCFRKTISIIIKTDGQNLSNDNLTGYHRCTYRLWLYDKVKLIKTMCTLKITNKMRMNINKIGKKLDQEMLKFYFGKMFIVSHQRE